MQPGTTIAGKFRVERMLGQGGMGVVVIATHLQLEQTVALKFLHDEIVSSPDIVERLMREARASAKLKSEHACRVMDVGQLESGAPYIVMELLEGEDLAAKIRRSPLVPVFAIELVLQAAVAIAEAHAAGIVHRDIKPSNLFVTERLDGTPLVKVLDFGIAKAAKAEAQLTRTTAIMGSPGYMSPEQLRSSKVVDHRTDIWALGVVLYEAVSGQLPFRSDTITELAVKVSMDEPEPLHTDPALAAVIARCLQKKPEDRYQSIAELADALAPIAGPRAATSAAMIARLSGRHAAVAAPVSPYAPQGPQFSPYPAQVAATVPATVVPYAQPFPPVAAPVPAAGFEPPRPPEFAHHGLPTAASARMPVGLDSKRGTPAWLFAVLGGVALIAVVAAIAFTRSDDDVSPEPRDDKQAEKDKPIPIAEIPKPGPGSGSATTLEVEAALKMLDDVYAQQNQGKRGTRDEALEFLDKAYAQQVAQQANKHDPDAVFGVDISGALAAGQVEGPLAAPVTIVMAYDLACPFCAKAEPDVRAMVAEHPGKVRAVYMNLVVHPQQVQTAHLYGCAAAKQGKFIQFTRGFVAGPYARYAANRNANELGEQAIITLATSLGLDIEKLRTDEAGCAQRLDADMTELRKFHVDGTPGFFINGKYLGGAVPKDQLEAIVGERLRVAEASGVPGGEYYQREIVGKGVHEFQAKPAKPPTRADAIAFLVDSYRQQKVQQAARDAGEPDPAATFAIDIAPAVAAKQVLGGPAPVTIVVASDFACPYCRKVDTTLRELYAEYPGKVRLVFMHMVVHVDTATTGHHYACAAAKQGKYAAFTDLFWTKSYDVYAASKGSDRVALSEGAILQYAGQAGLSIGKLRADANSDDCRDRVTADMAELARFKVTGTPTLYVNGRVVSGALPKEQFKQMIEEQLVNVAKSGTDGADYYDCEVFAKGLRQFRSKADATKP